MKKLTATIICTLLLSPAFAFPVIIKGKMARELGNTVSIESAREIESIVVPVDNDGNFLYRTDVPYPTDFQLSFGIGERAFKFYAFDKTEIILNVKSARDIEATGESKRSEAFCNAENVMLTKYATIVHTGTDIKQSLAEVERQVKSIPDIGQDEYTGWLADAIGLVLMTTVQATGKGTKYGIATTDRYKRLKANKEKLSGIELYNNLAWQVWAEQLKDEIRKGKNDDTYRPTYAEMYTLIEKNKKNVASKTYVNTRYFNLITGLPTAQSAEAKEQWKQDAQDFCNEYPQYAFTRYLGMQYEQLTNSPVGKPAPAFTLEANKGKAVSLEQFKGKYVLLDVWGSWCHPCRVMNKELTDIYPQYSEKDIAFVSVGYDREKKEWTKAIAEDNLTWTQLYYNEKFLSDYNVFSYPTVFLIGPDGKILKRTNHITKEEIDSLIK